MIDKLQGNFGKGFLVMILRILVGVSTAFLIACGDPQSNENLLQKNAITNEITVYKSPTCGCCAAWADYLVEEGYNVTSIDHDNMDAIKRELGLPARELASCHTAVIDGYLIEGHVPASDIQKLLIEKPGGVLGLTAPGMPAMSPGMGSREPQGYDVLSFTRDGKTTVFSSY